MPIVGAQDVWKTGSRVYVLEDGTNGRQDVTGSRLLDLGTIEVVNPATEIEESRLEDSDGGVKRLVTKELSKFTEKYEVQLYNLNMDNLRYLFYGGDIQSFSQAATKIASANVGQPGYLIKLRDTSSPQEMIYGLTSVDAVIYGESFPIAAVTSTTFAITNSTATQDGSLIFTVGSTFRVRGNTTGAANVVYTVISVSYSTPTTTITVASTNGAIASSGYVESITNLEHAITTGATTTTVKIVGDHSAFFTAGSFVYIWGATASAQNNASGAIYEVASVTFTTPNTVITFKTSSLTSPAVAYPSGSAVDGYIAKAYRPNAVDYTVTDLERGIVRCVSGAAMISGQAIKTVLTPRAITGGRLIRPQAKSGTFEGKVLIEWARGNFGQRTVREFQGIMTPGPGAFSDSEYSKFPLNIEVQADITNATNPAGRLLYYKGNLPDAS